MKIVVSHLTRMQPGYICVAGLETESGEHVRPVLKRGRLPARLLLRRGGPFDIGSVVDLGRVKRVGRPPEVEDCAFEPGRARRRDELLPDEFWDLLARSTRPDLKSIFGPELQAHARGCSVPEGKGAASLGCLRASGPLLEITSQNRIRLRLYDDGSRLSLPVTDLRLYEDDFQTPREDVVESVGRRLQGQTEVILGVGLSRPWARSEDEAPEHWLQVNNIHLSDEPLWRECGERAVAESTRGEASPWEVLRRWLLGAGGRS